MAKSTFEMKSPDMKKLKKFFKKAPHLLKPVSANVLDSLAFKTRKNDIKNIKGHMTVRNERFIKSAIRVTKTRYSADIDKQKSFVYSIKKPRFSGWKEQQTGAQPKKKKSISIHARGGNKRGIVRSKYRLKKATKFYKPEQFAGKSYKQRFYFMMRVLGSRGNERFLLSQNVQTKRGVLGKGMYEIKKHSIKRMQSFNKPGNIKRFEWRTKSLQQLSNQDVYRIWRRSLSAVIKRRGLKKS
jgi:hypothetical protein